MSGSAIDTIRAKAAITVTKFEPVNTEEPAEGPALTKIHVEETFTGDLQGEGIVEFVQASFPDGSASFVGVELVMGSISGRHGTFILQDAGTSDGRIVSGTWFVVPGSGTGELAGLRGEGEFRANLGQGAECHIDYWFDQ